MLSRRQFVALSVHAVAYAKLTHTARAPRRLRIGTITDPARPELQLGLAFGTAEASRSGALFDWAVEREEMSPSGFSADVSALVVSRDFHPSAAPMPTLNLSCLPLPLVTDAFTLADCRDHPRQPNARIELWHHTLERFGAQQLNDRFHATTGTAMTSDAWLGWFSIKLLFEAAMRARSTEPPALLAYLRRPTSEFDGHKGAPLRFDAQGRLKQPVYVIVRRPSSSDWIVEREIP